MFKFACGELASAFLTQDRRDGLGQNAEIFRQRPVVDIPAIELIELAKVSVGPTMNLPVASHSWCNDFAFTEALGSQADLGFDERTRTNETHIATEHIE